MSDVYRLKPLLVIEPGVIAILVRDGQIVRVKIKGKNEISRLWMVETVVGSTSYQVGDDQLWKDESVTVQGRNYHLAQES